MTTHFNSSKPSCLVLFDIVTFKAEEYKLHLRNFTEEVVEKKNKILEICSSAKASAFASVWALLTFLFA